MKIFTYVLMVIALGLIVFNVTKIDWNAPFTGQSGIAAIGVLAAGCVLLLMIILRTSVKIKEKSRRSKN